MEGDGDKIFSDVDTKCGMRRAQDGLHVMLNCIYCESEIEMVHPWGEVKAMLQGIPVGGVVPTDRGWKITIQCTQAGCEMKNTYEITQDELEEQAQKELAHRQRLARHVQQG
jgi:hypothetical protein